MSAVPEYIFTTVDGKQVKINQENDTINTDTTNNNVTLTICDGLSCSHPFAPTHVNKLRTIDDRTFMTKKEFITWFYDSDRKEGTPNNMKNIQISPGSGQELKDAFIYVNQNVNDDLLYIYVDGKTEQIDPTKIHGPNGKAQPDFLLSSILQFTGGHRKTRRHGKKKSIHHLCKSKSTRRHRKKKSARHRKRKGTHKR